MNLFKEIRHFPGNLLAVHRDKFWRVVCLIIGIHGASAMVTGFSYLPTGDVPGSLPPGIDLMTEVLPPTVWGMLWLSLGLWSVLSAATGLRSTDSVVAVLMLSVVWMLAYVFGFITEGGRGYLNAATYTRTLIGPVLLLLVYRVVRSVAKRETDDA